MTRNQIVELYSATFNRAADADGVAYWETQTNLTQEQMANSFVISAEAVALYPTTQTNTEYVTAIYNNLFGRAPEADGLAYWVGKLDDGTDKKESMIAAFINGASTADKAVLDNKTAVSLYAVEQNSNTTTVSLSSVTADAATVAAAKTAVDQASPDFGETFVLTTSVDTITGTDKNDLVTGVTSSLSADKTLSNGDIIDGGAGTDTAKFSMNSNFTGFTGDGKMENVENVELTNDSTISRSFDAKGVTGVEKYTVDAKGGDVELKNLDAAGVTVDYSGEKASAVKVGFTTDAVKGTADELTLKVTDLGTAKVEKTSTTAEVAAKYSAVTAKGIETLNVESKGSANLVNLSTSTDVKSVNVSGSADLDVEAVANTVTSFNAAEATGKVTADLTGASTSLKTVTAGTSDDNISIDTKNILANAEIAGGAGEDKLTLTNTTAGADIVQFAMSGIETIVAKNANTKDITFSATNVSDVSTIEVGTTYAGTFKYVNAADTDLALKANGTIGTGAAINTDNTGATTVNLSATAAKIKDKTQETNSITIDASKTTNLTVDVEEYVSSASAITAAKATAVTLNVATGKSSGTTPTEQTEYKGAITAEKAETITVDASGILDADITAKAATSAIIKTAAAASKLALVAEKLETLEVTAAKGLDLTGSTASASTSDLAKVQTLEATTGAALNIGALASAANVTITGNEADSEATIASIGTTSVDYSTTVTAVGLAEGFTVTGATTVGEGADITFDLSGVTGDVVLGSIAAGGTVATDKSGAVTFNAGNGDTQIGTGIAGKTVTINAAESLGTLDADGSAGAIGISAYESVVYNGTSLNANKSNIAIAAGATTFTAELNGGLEADAFTIAVAASLTNLTVTGNLDMGTTDTITITDTAGTAIAQAATIDVSAVQNATAITIDVTNATGKMTIIGNDNTTSITGGTTDDTITITSKDTAVVDGKGGTNTLKIDAAGAFDYSAATTVANINTLDLKVNSSDTDLVLTAAQFIALTTVKADTTDTIKVTDIADSASLKATDAIDTFVVSGLTDGQTASIASIGAGDKIDTGLTSLIEAAANANDTALTYAITDDGSDTTITYELLADSSTSATVVLTGVVLDVDNFSISNGVITVDSIA